MRIAFVGKGGSGKSTLAASFVSYLENHTTKPIVVFDADLNIHLPNLLGFDSSDISQHLSNPVVEKVIKKWLIGTNKISDLGAFRKSTPPTRKSNIFNLENITNTPLHDFSITRQNLTAMAVGTYQEDDIGASCYHNNLAILESLLNHTNDKNGYVVVDMVAGVDSFAGTLHAQFDFTCLIVEPTKRSLEVYEKYLSLAKEAGVDDNLVIISNKVRDQADIDFIESNISKEKLLGHFYEDDYVRLVDQTGEPVNFKKLNQPNQLLLEKIFTQANSLPDNRDKRLKKIWEIHRKYVAQAFVVNRFGDLTTQIDPELSFRQVDT